MQTALGKHWRLSGATKAKMRIAKAGYTPEMAGWNKGISPSEETKRKISESNKGKHGGPKSYNWKGGVSRDKKYVSWLKNRRGELLRTKQRGSFAWQDWVYLRNRCNGVCPACGRAEPEIKLTIDHIVPISKGGTNTINNIQPLCRSCNSKKHDKIIRYV
jgi:5-methylcytosine-specific restriction endonuclease McrA